MVRFVPAVLSLGLIAAPASAHFNMLLPQTTGAKKGSPVMLLYQWGHPFEHQLFDAPAPTVWPGTQITDCQRGSHPGHCWPGSGERGPGPSAGTDRLHL